MESKHEIKTCPRCKQSFECKVGDVANCQCNIALHQKTKEFLRKTHNDCLCAKCLMEVNHLVELTQMYPFPTQAEMFIEGLHYYKENGKFVFTEFFHILRGSCCGSGCRHCPYKYK